MSYLRKVLIPLDLPGTCGHVRALSMNGTQPCRSPRPRDHRRSGYQIWIAATSREDAVSRVLDCVPEGWTASLLEQSLNPNEAAVLKLEAGDVRKLKG